MIKLNQATLDKLEDLLTLAGYTVRHEKGNFKSGSCIIETSRLIVLNKFSTVETKAAFLIGALKQIPVDEQLLDDRQIKMLQELQQMEISFPTPENQDVNL